MESDKYICIREAAGDNVNVVIVDLATPTQPTRRPIKADAAIMNPVSKVIALRLGGHLQIFNIEMKAKMKTHDMPETDPVVFWKWINTNTVAIVTATTVYHWAMEGAAGPQKVFERHSSLEGTQIINYRVSDDGQWCALIGIAAQPDGKVAGFMQLFSVARNVSQPIEAYAAVFGKLASKPGQAPYSVLAFAARSPTGAKLHIVEVPGSENAEGRAPFQKRNVDITYAPDAPNDFPVAMQVSPKYSVIFLVTKHGYLHLYDLETAACISM